MSWTQTMTTTAKSTNWEDLRKRARQIENEIDTKLVTFNKLGVSLGDQHKRFDLGYSASGSVEKAPLLSTQSTFETLCCELEQCLSRLTELNDKMAEFVNGGASTSGLSTSSALHHMLQRHRDILTDYTNEFQRTRANIQSRLDRESLLGSANSDSESYGRGLNNRRNDSFLKEHEHIRSSDRLIDEQIAIAISTKDHLQSQRGGLRDISKKINTLTKRYPAINSVMQKISIKKRRDTIVLAAVITVCLILMFLYVWR